MSDESDTTAEQKNKPRKVARSASTAERPAFEPGQAPAAEGEAKENVRKWDVRAERPAAPSEGRRPPRPRREGEAEGGPRRPGSSGGRAMPNMPRRGPVDRGSADFVDRWLSSPQRPPREPGPPGPRPDGAPGGERGERRGDRRDRGPQGGRGRPEARPVMKAKPVAPEAPQKLSTMSETILVGLPKVAAQKKNNQEQQAKPKTAKEALAARTQGGNKPQKEEPKKGETVVLPAWISVGADKAVATLLASGPAGEALVSAWLDSNNVAAIAAAANADAVSGASRKAAKRALSVLKSRGVDLPEQSVAAPAVRTAEAEVIEATFSPPDARGTSSITIAKRRGGDRAHIAEVIVREGTGIVNAVSGYMSRSQIKEAHQRIADSTGVPPAAVPVEWARLRIRQAEAQNATSGALIPLGMERCKDLLEPEPGTSVAHPVADLEAGVPAEGNTAPAGLHAEPEFRTWMPEGSAMDELLKSVGEKLSADDAKDPAKVDVVLAAEVKAATDRYFTPDARGTLAARMRDAAITIRARSGEDRAREVLSAAKAIESAGLITSPPSELEFLKVFFQKGLSLLAQRQGGSLRVPMANG